MILNVREFDSSGFTHKAAEKLLICEASDLQLNGFFQLYDDACDVGLALRNRKTNNLTRWYLKEDETVHDSEGDVSWWILYPTYETLMDNPSVEGYKLKIFND